MVYRTGRRAETPVPRLLAAKQRRRVDYDDLLLYWAHMVGRPALASEIGTRFNHILVDEYQDTNPLQSSILMG